MYRDRKSKTADCRLSARRRFGRAIVGTIIIKIRTMMRRAGDEKDIIAAMVPYSVGGVSAFAVHVSLRYLQCT